MVQPVVNIYCVAVSIFILKHASARFVD